MTRFKGGLEEHKGHSAIIMAGGGNFNESVPCSQRWRPPPSPLIAAPSTLLIIATTGLTSRRD